MTPKSPLILPFADIRAADLPLVGGKGANLGEMAHAGFPVPPGFCLTTIAFRQFIAACPHADDLYALLDTVTTDDVETARQVGQQVRQTLLETPMPLAIAEAIRQQWQTLGADQAYAVRSSATAEDLPDASFAGQQDTYLNIIGETELLTAVQRCWVSLFTDRAILYRVQNQFSHRDVQLSVVVQQMVMAQKSGILFTVDPLTGHRHTLTIDASFGLGEALVGGLVSPDSYHVDKRDMTIIDRKIADKQVAILPDNNGGVHQEALDDAQRSQTVLSDAHILELAKMGSQIEAHYDTPQDIEWAIADEKIYLLQSRPITSLYPITGLTSLDDSLHIFLSLGHQQSMTRAMSPLSLSTIQVLMPIGHAESRFDNAYIRASGGRMFADISQPLRHPLLGKAMLKMLGQLDALAPDAAKQVMQRPEFQRSHGLRLNFATAKAGFKIVRRVMSALWWRNLTGFANRTNALMDEYMENMTARLQMPSGRSQLQAVLDALPTVFLFFLNWVPEAAAGIAATRLLTRLTQRWLSPDEQEALTLGIPGNVVNEMNLMIDDLADLARQTPQLAEYFNQLGDDGHGWLEEAAKIEDSIAFMKSWHEFIARYGMRGPAEIDIMMPRWREEPLPVLQVIAGSLQQESVSQRSRQESFIQEREVAFQKLLASAGRGALGWLRTRLFKRLYHTMTEVGGMREHHKFMAVRVLGVVKEILKDNAIHLTQTGKLENPDDVWFLTWEELFAIGDDETINWHPIIAQRRANLERFQKLSPQIIITNDGESPAVQYRVDDAPPGALLGNPVSSGMIEGVVRVIHDPQREMLSPGEILVAEFTDPGWTPLFINAAGLILEVGGALTHGAVVAREYGIPAVVGVREATTALQTGQHVRIDGNRGIIELC
ncbi:phosphoenolpyruvate synthase [Candidatus Leptofilum sp.]|uniref:phosphoenolpyruvate synthase n=1 Tax=Candidatus Leptofilum sp. TaxID=3241576 RepID=UPI003B593A2F